jgi:hypothetical protein
MKKMILLAFTFACLFGGQRVYSHPVAPAVGWEVIDATGTGKIQIVETEPLGAYELQAPRELVTFVMVMAEDTAPGKLPVAVIPLAFIEQPGCIYSQTCNRWTRRAEYDYFTSQKVTPQVSARSTLIQRSYGREKY